MNISERHRKEISSLLKMSADNLKDAKVLFSSNSFRGAISRAYYVFFDTAKAALLAKDIIVQSHAGAITKFGEHFVKTGLIKNDYGRAFNQALEIRIEADYEALREFSGEEAQELIIQAEKFYGEVSRIIGG